MLEYAFNNNLSFSFDHLRNTEWNNGSEVIDYCEKCNLLKLGEGANRMVFQINDQCVLKIEKFGSGQGRMVNGMSDCSHSQNYEEVSKYQECNDQMKDFIPHIFDWDRRNKCPLWIVSEQVLPASYADFQKLLGIDFGSYISSADITQMKQDLADYSKYDGKRVNSFSVNLMSFLEAYEEGDLSLYKSIIHNNQWFKELYEVLEYGLANPWELQIIDNWGLVNRNGKPKLIILDIGI